MQTKADVQRRVVEFLNRKRWSMRKLALTIGLPPSTLARMMEENPTYRGEPAAFEDAEENALRRLSWGQRQEDTEADRS